MAAAPSHRGMRYGSSNGRRAVEIGIAGGRDACRERDRRERDAALAHGADRFPVQRKAGRRRLEGGRQPGDRRPHIPQRERRRHVRVLDRPAVAREAGPDRVERTVEAQRSRAADGRAAPRRSPTACDAPTEGKTIAWRKGGGSGRSSVRVRKSPAPKTTAENVWTSVRGAARPTSREPHFDRWLRVAQVHAVQAGRQRRRVVRDHQIAGPQEIDEPRSRRVRDVPVAHRRRAACASRGRWTGRSAAIIGRSPRPRYRRPRAGAGPARPPRWRRRARARQSPAA